jgi:cytoskeletal protein CcmA (bactofilin family)
MALFKKENNGSKGPASVVKTANTLTKEAISSVISPDMQIKGEIQFTGKARLDGNLEGDLHGEYLILSETGTITGDLQLDTLICHGKIEGNIFARVVTIHSTAAIKGKLTAASLTVEPGALLSGEISAAYEKKQITSQQKAIAPKQGPEQKDGDKENQKTQP